MHNHYVKIVRSTKVIFIRKEKEKHNSEITLTLASSFSLLNKIHETHFAITIYQEEMCYIRYIEADLMYRAFNKILSTSRVHPIRMRTNKLFPHY